MASTSKIPEPALIECVVHGQRVQVKVYPPASDPRWEGWLREKLRSPLEAFGQGDRALD